jgi:putative tryptophan/tyrosine transport system substrate-binding protein
MPDNSGDSASNGNCPLLASSTPVTRTSRPASIEEMKWDNNCRSMTVLCCAIEPTELCRSRVETLNEIAPQVSRVGFILHPETPANVGLLRAAETGVPSSVKLVALGVHNTAEIERAVTTFATEPNGGLIVAPHAITFANRDILVDFAARYRLPAVYAFRTFATSGGLISYGTNPLVMWREGASYVDRILKGAKPADLPAQFPNKYELVINLKTAKALGLTVPPLMLGRADDIIE